MVVSIIQLKATINWTIERNINAGGKVAVNI